MRLRLISIDRTVEILDEVGTVNIGRLFSARRLWNYSGTQLELV